MSMKTWELTKYEWNEATSSMIVGRQWRIQADRVEVDNYTLRGYRDHASGLPQKATLSYISRDWDDVTLVDEEA